MARRLLLLCGTPVTEVFYKHFGSKGDLLVESLSMVFREIVETLVRAVLNSRPRQGVEGNCENLPEPGVCEYPERGCPRAALAAELARADERMKSLNCCGARETTKTEWHHFSCLAREPQIMNALSLRFFQRWREQLKLLHAARSRDTRESPGERDRFSLVRLLTSSIGGPTRGNQWTFTKDRRLLPVISACRVE